MAMDLIIVFRIIYSIKQKTKYQTRILHNSLILII